METSHFPRTLKVNKYLANCTDGKWSSTNLMRSFVMQSNKVFFFFLAGHCVPTKPQHSSFTIFVIILLGNWSSQIVSDKRYTVLRNCVYATNQLRSLVVQSSSNEWSFLFLVGHCVLNIPQHSSLKVHTGFVGLFWASN